MNQLKLSFFTKKHCPLCDKAHKILEELQQEIPFQLEEIDIYTDDALIERYGLMIPVIAMDDEVIEYGQINKEQVRKRLLILSK
ncbi:glutaredoxin family protein [Fictibacillus sp. Mic-4]|uniref:glutaredoxin family protein n=1 Tax=Fictibacillus TaxID=1329200 RepID=UPI000421BF5A|nr:glutaredoxin family protein [Fictibacillus gelatini]